MKTSVITKTPTITLQGSCYNGTGEMVELFLADFVGAEVGQAWDDGYCGGCGRDCYNEHLKMVYKDETGCACLLTRYRSSDDPDPTCWEEKSLFWIEV